MFNVGLWNVTDRVPQNPSRGDVELEINLEDWTAAKEFVEKFKDEIERLPRPKTELARDPLFRVFQRFCEDTLGRKCATDELVLNAFERDECWALASRIDEMPVRDVANLAEIRFPLFANLRRTLRVVVYVGR